MILKNYKDICDYVTELEKERTQLKEQIVKLYKNGQVDNGYKVSLWERNSYKANKNGEQLAKSESLIVPDTTAIRKFTEIKKLSWEDYLDITSSSLCLSVKTV